MNLGFYEETVFSKDKKNENFFYKLFSISAIVFFTAFVIMVIITFAVPDLRTLAVIISAVLLISGIFLFIRKDYCIICYDYTFVDGTIRISKIINNKKRKEGITFDCTNIEKIQKNSFGNDKKYKIYDYSINPDKDTVKIYLKINLNYNETVVILEPTEKLISLILKANKNLQI